MEELTQESYIPILCYKRQGTLYTHVQHLRSVKDQHHQLENYQTFSVLMEKPSKDAFKSELQAFIRLWEPIEPELIKINNSKPHTLPELVRTRHLLKYTFYLHKTDTCIHAYKHACDN